MRSQLSVLWSRASQFCTNNAAWTKKLKIKGAFGRVELPLTAAGNTVDPDKVLVGVVPC